MILSSPPPPEKDAAPRNWFTTLPGLFTSAGTFIVAITGLLIALNQVGILPVKTAPNGAPTPKPTVATRSDLDREGHSPSDVVRQFYDDQNRKDLSAAYALLSTRSQTQDATLPQFMQAWGGTSSIAAEVRDASGNVVPLIVTWTQNGKTRIFDGHWTLVRENGIWKLDDYRFTVR